MREGYFLSSSFIILLFISFLCISKSVRGEEEVAACASITGDNKQIKLTQDITNNPLSACFEINNAKNITFVGQGKTISGSFPTAFKITDSVNITVSNVSVSFYLNAFQFVNCSNCFVSHSKIHDLATEGVAITLQTKNTIAITENSFYNLYEPNYIVSSSSSTFHFERNKISNITKSKVDSGFIYVATSSAYIQQNNFSNLHIGCDSSGDSSQGVKIVNVDNSLKIPGDMVFHNNNVSNVYDTIADDCAKSLLIINGENLYYNTLSIDNNHIENIKLNGNDYNPTFTFVSVDSMTLRSNVSITRNTVNKIDVNKLRPFGLQSLDTNVTITENIFSGISSEQSAYEMQLYSSSDFLPTVYGNSMSVIFPYIGSSNFDEQCNVNSLPRDFSSLCYPPSLLPCCHFCVQDSVCIGNFGSDNYAMGSCGAHVTDVCSFGRTIYRTLTGLSSYTFVFNVDNELNFPRLSGPGLDEYYPNLKVFNNGSAIPFYWNGGYGAYIVQLGSFQDDQALSISMSLSGSYDNSLPSFVVLLTHYKPIIEWQPTWISLIASWDAYEGPLNLSHYRVEVYNSSTGALVDNTTVNVPHYEYFTTSAVEYKITLTPEFVEGRGPQTQSTFVWSKGTQNYDWGSTGDEEILKLIPMSNDKLLGIGTTTGTMGTIIGTNAQPNAKYLVIAELAISTGAYNTLAQFTSGSGNDNFKDAFLGSDNYLYILGENNIQTYVARFGMQPSFALSGVNTAIFSNYNQETISINAISPGPSGHFLLFGTTNGDLSPIFLAASNKRAYYAAFTMNTAMTENPAIKLLWSVGIQDHVTQTMYNEGAKMLYILGKTLGPALVTTSFVSQLTLDPLSAPKTYVYRLETSQLTDAPPPQSITFNAERDLIAVTSDKDVIYIPTNPSTGFIEEYLGCIATASLPANMTQKTISMQYPYDCRDNCAGFKYYYLNLAQCYCSDDLPTNSDADSLCVKCSVDASMPCGGVGHMSGFSTTSSTVRTYATPGNIGKAVFHPSNANTIALIGTDNSEYFVVAELSSASILYTNIPTGMKYNDVWIHPTKLYQVLAGSINIQVPTNYFEYKGGYDMYGTVIFEDSTSISLAVPTYRYKNFTSLTIEWSRPRIIPDSTVVTYTLYKQFQNETKVAVYTGGALGVLINSDPFEHFYHLTAILSNYRTDVVLEAAQIYTAKIIQFGTKMNSENGGDQTSIIRYHLDHFYAVYRIGYQIHGIKINPDSGLCLPWGDNAAGSSFHLLDARVNYDSVIYVLGTGSVLKFGASIESSSVVASVNNEKFTSIDIADNNVWVAGNFYDESSSLMFLTLRLIYPNNSVEIYSDKLSVYNYTIATSYDPVIVRVHHAKQLLFIGSYNSYEFSSSLLVIQLADWTITQYSFPQSWISDIIVDETTDIARVIMASTTFSSYKVHLFYINQNKFSVSPSSSVSYGATFAQAQTKGAGLWRYGTGYTDNGLELSLYYNDYSSADASKLAIGFGTNAITPMYIAAGSALNIAVAGVMGNGNPIGPVIDGNGDFFVLFHTETVTPTKANYRNPTGSSFELFWGVPTGVLKTDQVKYTVEVDKGNGWDNIGEVTDNYSQLITGLQPLTVYKYRLSATVGTTVVPYFSGDTPYGGASTGSANTRYIYHNVAFSTLNNMHVTFDEETSILYVYVGQTPAPSSKRDNKEERSFTFGQDGKELAVFDVSDSGLYLYSMNVSNIPDQFKLTGLAINKDKTVLGAGYVDDKAFMCNFGVTASSCQQHFPSPGDTRSSHLFRDMIIVDDKIWVVGSTYGTVSGTSRHGNFDAFVTVIESDGDKDSLQLGSIYYDNAIAITYNKHHDLYYILYYSTDSISTISVAIVDDDLNLVQTYTKESSTQDADFIVTETAAYILDHTQNTISHLNLTSNGMIVTTADTINLGQNSMASSLAYSKENGLLISGATSTSIFGYNRAGFKDAFYGTAYTNDLLVQYGASELHSSASAILATDNRTYIAATQTPQFALGYSYIVIRIDGKGSEVDNHFLNISSVGAHTVNLSWSLGQYLVEFSNDATNFALVPETVGLTHKIFSNLEPNTTYYFRLKSTAGVYYPFVSVTTLVDPTLKLESVGETIILAWNNVYSNLTYISYEMQVRYETNQFQTLQTLTETYGSYTAFSLSFGTEYVFIIKYVENNVTFYSPEIRAIPQAQNPSIPTEPIVSWISHTRISLAWATSLNGTYILFMNNSALPASGGVYIVDDLTPGATYSFYMGFRGASAIDLVNSTSITVTTLVPPIIYVEKVGPTSMQVRWLQANSFNTLQYYLEYSKSAIFTAIKIVSDKEGDVNLPGLISNTTYSFRFRVVDPVSEYVFTTITQTTLSVNIPSLPTVSQISHQSIVLSWNTDQPGVYILQANATGSFSNIYSGVNSSYVVTKLQPNTTYSFRIFLSNETLGNYTSNILNVKTYPLAVLSYSGIAATQVNLSVSDVFSTMSYTLQESTNLGASYNTTQRLVAAAGPFTVTNLNPGATYVYRLLIRDNIDVQAPDYYSNNITIATNTSNVCVGSACSCARDQIRCNNGTCVNSQSQCITRATACPSSRSFRCTNQTCVASYKECNVTSSCTGVVCWDGACEVDVGKCKSIPACPYFSKKCPDGSCVPSNEICKDQNSVCPSDTLCSDGSCPPCFISYGCPPDAPVLCPNGKCALSEEACRYNCSGTAYECFDGTCKENYTMCSTPPRLNYPMEFSYFLPQQNETNKDGHLSVDIITEDGLSIAEVLLPYGILGSEEEDQILQVGPVPDSLMFNVNGTDVFGNSSYSSSIVSSVLSLVIEGSSEEVFTVKVKINYNNALPPNTNISNLCLGFINRTTQSWQCESNIEVIDGELVGYTSHFTEFAVLVGKVSAPKVNVVTIDDFTKLKDINKNTIAVYVLSGIVFIYLVGLVFTIKMDRKIALYNKMTTFDNRTSISLTDLSSLETSGEPGSPGSPSRRSISSRNSLVFKPEEDGIKDEKGEKVGLRTLIFARLRIKHSWVAVAFSPMDAPLTKTAMLTLLLCMILGNLLISAAFYQNREDTGIAQRVITGIIVACIVFPITLILSLLFRKMPKKFFFVSYIIAYLFCAVAIIITLIYTLKFGEAKSHAWLVAIAISTSQDGAINQPIKLLLSSIIIIIFPTAWFTALLL